MHTTLIDIDLDVDNTQHHGSALTRIPVGFSPSSAAIAGGPQVN